MHQISVTWQTFMDSLFKTETKTEKEQNKGMQEERQPIR